MSDEEEKQIGKLLDAFAPLGAISTAVASIVGIRNLLVEQGFTQEQAGDIVAGLWRGVGRDAKS